VTARDGWTLRYDPAEACLFFADEKGVPQYHWSGDVGGKFWEQQRERFLQEHGEQQLRLL